MDEAAAVWPVKVIEAHLSGLVPLYSWLLSVIARCKDERE